jgi:hypothetical protein
VLVGKSLGQVFVFVRSDIARPTGVANPDDIPEGILLLFNLRSDALRIMA